VKFIKSHRKKTGKQQRKCKEEKEDGIRQKAVKMNDRKSKNSTIRGCRPQPTNSIHKLVAALWKILN
jgi:hypothetical protein